LGTSSTNASGIFVGAKLSFGSLKSTDFNGNNISVKMTCQAWGGVCANGNLVPLEHRVQHDHCGSCDAGYVLNGTSCRHVAQNAVAWSSSPRPPRTWRPTESSNATKPTSPSSTLSSRPQVIIQKVDSGSTNSGSAGSDGFTAEMVATIVAVMIIILLTVLGCRRHRKTQSKDLYDRPKSENGNYQNDEYSSNIGNDNFGNDLNV